MAEDVHNYKTYFFSTLKLLVTTISCYRLTMQLKCHTVVGSDNVLNLRWIKENVQLAERKWCKEGLKENLELQRQIHRLMPNTVINKGVD